MIDTLKRHMSAAVEGATLWDVAGEKDRHDWLFDFSCQNGLTTTQIFWTSETTAALEEYVTFGTTGSVNLSPIRPTPCTASSSHPTIGFTTAVANQTPSPTTNEPPTAHSITPGTRWARRTRSRSTS